MIALLIKTSALSKEKIRCRKKFLTFFPDGFTDTKYLAWERNYKWNAHMEWENQLNKKMFSDLLSKKQYREIAKRAVNIETKTNLLFSFEKMALRDAVKSAAAAKSFSTGLFNMIYGKEKEEIRFSRFVEILASLPRRQTRVLTWPLTTVFSFLARPEKFIFFKPRVTQKAALVYGFPFHYESRPNWYTYSQLLGFASSVAEDLGTLKPKDFIDLQSFIWVLGSEEYD